MKKLLKRVITVILLLSLLTASGILFSSCEKNGTSSESGYSSSSEQGSDLSSDSSSDSAAEDSSSGNGAEESGSGGGLINGGNYEAH